MDAAGRKDVPVCAALCWLVLVLTLERCGGKGKGENCRPCKEIGSLFFGLLLSLMVNKPLVRQLREI